VTDNGHSRCPTVVKLAFGFAVSENFRARSGGEQQGSLSSEPLLNRRSSKGRNTAVKKGC